MSVNRRQISLRQILIVIGLLSVVFALAGPGKLPLSATFLLLASLGVAAGLWQQARDIGEAMTARDAPTDPVVLQTWRFEKNWRYVFAAFVFCGWLLAAFSAQGIFGSTDAKDIEFRASPTNYADGLVLLVVVVGFASSVVHLRETPRTSFARWVHRAGWLAGIALLAAVTLYETALIDALIHIAIRGIEMAQPLPYGEAFYAGGVWMYKSRVARFAWLQLILAGAVLLNAALLTRMTGRCARRWHRVGYALSMVAALGIALWDRFYGFASISPVQAGVEALWIASVWRPAIPLIVLFGFAATYRLLAHPRQPTDEGPNWRPAGKIYLSESWWTIAVAVLGSLWHSLSGAYHYFSILGFSVSTAVGPLEILASPPYYLHLAVFAVCVQLTNARLRARPLVGEVPMELDLNRFAFTWIAVALTTYVALEAVIGTSFVYWIIPWEPLPLF